MSRRRPKSESRNYDYTEVLDDEVDSREYRSVRPEETKGVIPYKTLAFILVFFVMGSVSSLLHEVKKSYYKVNFPDLHLLRNLDN